MAQAEKYIEAIGRRKTATARVRVYTERKKDGIVINDKKLEEYFPFVAWQKYVKTPLEVTNLLGSVYLSVRVKGGGVCAQAQAIRHGIARVLEKLDPNLRQTLKPLGLLKRDPRAKERKKFGLKRARRAPQWSKR